MEQREMGEARSNIVEIRNTFLLENTKKIKVKLSLYQAVKAHSVVRRRGAHIF
jgi:hypothetical protein